MAITAVDSTSSDQTIYNYFAIDYELDIEDESQVEPGAINTIARL